ncbi:MAG: hypothetical protein KJ645_03335 [Planctomycetes bacterium]|nr:hypothetical protein [Planctomycetota bacterium]
MRLSSHGKLEIRMLTTSFMERPSAKLRILALVSDPRQFDPDLLLQSALGAIRKKQRQRDYEKIRSQRSALLADQGPEEADRLLVEMTERLQKEKGAKKTVTKRPPDRDR